jgi:hypothetical protein
MISKKRTKFDGTSINWNNLFIQYSILSRLLSYLNTNINHLLFINHNIYSSIKIYNFNELLLKNQLNISSLINLPIVKNEQFNIFKQISIKELQFINKVIFFIYFPY